MIVSGFVLCCGSLKLVFFVIVDFGGVGSVCWLGSVVGEILWNGMLVMLLLIILIVLVVFVIFGLCIFVVGVVKGVL